MSFDACMRLFVVGIAIALSSSGLFCLGYAPLEESGRTLADFPELFKKDVTIVVGQNASQIVVESVNSITQRLKALTGNDPISLPDFKVSPKERKERNLILVGTPDSNLVLDDAYQLSQAIRVTHEYPGKGQGILEILSNPWSKDKALLIIAGSDQLGVKAAVAVLTGSQELNRRRLTAKWRENRKTASPFFSKIGATLDLLRTMRTAKQIPREMNPIVTKDTVGVSIKFSHVLDDLEVRSISGLGLKFKRLPSGEIAHSGSIYGAEIPWDLIDDLAGLEFVIRVESTWQLGVEEPAEN